MNSNATLFAGIVLDGRDPDHPQPKLRDGTAVIVRVREMPARHHLELLDLFHVGREAELLQRVIECGTEGEAGKMKWSPVDAAFVDNLDDLSFERIVQLADQLNFKRAIATAERQIARGQALRPMMERMAKTMLEPMRQELASWTSSLTTQLSQALAGKQP